MQAISEHQGVCQICDVFRGTTKMHPFAHVLQCRVLEAFFEVIFDRFHVMANGRLDRFQVLSLLAVERRNPGLQELPFERRQGTDMGEIGAL
jgi:hypothetical protein